MLGCHGFAYGFHIGVAGGRRCLIHIAHVHDGLVGKEIEVFCHLLFLGVFRHYGAAGQALLQGFPITEQEREEFPGFFVSAGGGLFLHLLDAVFHRFQVFYLEFGIHHFLVTHRVYGAIYMHDIVVVEATEHVQDGVGLADVGQELVAQPLALGSALHQAGDIHNLHRGGDGALGLANLRKHLQALVRNIGGPHVGVDGTEREIGALGLPGAYTVK